MGKIERKVNVDKINSDESLIKQLNEIDYMVSELVIINKFKTKENYNPFENMTIQKIKKYLLEMGWEKTEERKNGVIYKKHFKNKEGRFIQIELPLKEVSGDYKIEFLEIALKRIKQIEQRGFGDILQDIFNIPK